MKLRVKTLPGGVPPLYGREGDAALDFFARIDAPLTLAPGDRATIGTGVQMAIPESHFGLMAPRSGLGSRGLTLANGVGIIDSNYRGELIANVVNTGVENISIAPGSKFVQLVILPMARCAVEVVETLDETVRGAGAFGSSGH